MNYISRILIILSVGLISCTDNNDKFLDKEIIKQLYNYDCFEFRMDTLKSLNNIKPFLDSLSKCHPDICSVNAGYIYNIYDSAFTPSHDSTKNIVIKLDDIHNCPIIGLAGHNFIMHSISNDSLTMTISPFTSDLYFSSRIHINELAYCFNKNLDSLFNESKMSDNHSFIIMINLLDQPQKLTITKILETCFWEYNIRVLNSIKNDCKKQNLTVEKLLRLLSEKNMHLLNLVEPIHFDLINDAIDIPRLPIMNTPPN